MAVRGEFVVLGFAVLLVGGVGAMAVQARQQGAARSATATPLAQHRDARDAQRPAAAVSAPPRDFVVTANRTLLELDGVPVRAIALPAPARDAEEVRRTLAARGGGTYIGEMLAQEDSMLVRWPDRTLTALRVWVQPHADVPGWSDGYPQVVRDVFPEWSVAGFPIRFLHVLDSATADLHIRFTRSLPGLQIGLTNRFRDEHGWIVAAEIILATGDQSGKPLPAGLISAIARHEVGHALGLGHASDPAMLMFPESRTTTITATDRATLHLLYSLPPGTVR
ncbi:MAG: matrixin family metalloprotease [Gemmatimonadaceae bacterium]|nr:matrixin family metalloprotease [Gemmatimonadaceae bacterium]